jgi:hypothetical protein
LPAKLFPRKTNGVICYHEKNKFSSDSDFGCSAAIFLCILIYIGKAIRRRATLGDPPTERERENEAPHFFEAPGCCKQTLTGPALVAVIYHCTISPRSRPQPPLESGCRKDVRSNKALKIMQWLCGCNPTLY